MPPWDRFAPPPDLPEPPAPAAKPWQRFAAPSVAAPPPAGSSGEQQPDSSSVDDQKPAETQARPAGEQQQDQPQLRPILDRLLTGAKEGAAAIPDSVGRFIGGIKDEITGQTSAAWDKLKADWTAANPGIGTGKEGFWEAAKKNFDSAVSMGKVPLDAFNLVMAPLSGAVVGAAKPVEAATGGLIKAEDLGTALQGIRAGPGPLKLAKPGMEGPPMPPRLGTPGIAEAPPAPAGEPKAAPAPEPPPKPAAPPPAEAGAAEGPSLPSDVPPGTALTRPPDLTQPRAFEDQLFALESNATADKLDVLKRAKALPDVPPATWEKLYHYEEDPKGVSLTPAEKTLYDQHVAPLADESSQLLARLKDFGVPLDPEGYTPRYVQGRTRSYGEMLDQWKKGVEAKFGGAPGRSMRTTADAERARRFYKAVNPETGEAQVVYVAPDRSVMRFDESTATNKFDLGAWGKLRSPKIQPGAKFEAGGKQWRLEQATTKEIEAVASIRYHKNVIANRLDNVQKLRSAVRNAEFIEGMKKSPDWDKVAVEVRDQAPPPETNGRPWRIPQMPQFRQFYMEPRLADAIDDFAKSNRSIEGLQGGLDKIGHLIKASIFYNPIPHLANVWNHYMVERGLVGGAMHAPTMVRTGMKAIRAVATQNEDYIKALRSGASLPYARLLTRDVHQTLISKLGQSIQDNPREASALAKAFGYANPVEWIRGIYRASSHALWAGSDVMTLARIMELQERGRGVEQAIRETEAHMPNYRVPGQVAGSRLLSQALQSPLLSMFGRYQYNRLASYGHMVRDLVSREVPLAQKAETLDKMAMLGAYMFVFYPLLDKAWQEITGNPNASTTRSGAASVPQAAMDLVKGDKDLVQAGQSVFSPGVAMEVPAEVLFGRYLWNGQPIANIDDLKHLDAKFLTDLAKYGASKIAPAGQAASAFNDREGVGAGLKRLGLAQIQVKSPSQQTVDLREKYKHRAETAAERARNKAAAGRSSALDKLFGGDQ